MSQSIDRIFNLHGPESEVFRIIIDIIDRIFMDLNNRAEFSADMLRAYCSKASTLRNYDQKMVEATIELVTSILTEDTQIIPLLISKLSDYRDRVLAATMLGWLGSKAHAAIPTLVGHASGQGPATEAAKQAILRIGQAAWAITAALDDSIVAGDDGAFRELYSLALRGEYTTTPGFFRIVAAAAHSKSAHIREAAADAIGQMDSVRKEHYMTLLNQLKVDPDSNVRRSALEASRW